MTSPSTFDALVVGSGPNGLAAAIRLAEQGLSVKVFEASDTIGGGMRTKELMQPGFHHDICSAIHPMAASSPYLKHLPLDQYGLQWITPDYPVAHPLDDGTSVMMHHSIEKTMDELGDDGEAYRSAMDPIARQWDSLTADFLGPLRFPKHPINLALFGLKALQPASLFQKRFKEERAKALFAGLAAHSILPLNAISTSAIGLVLGAAGHAVGWPLPRGGSQSIANAMAGYLESMGGEIETGAEIESLNQLPPHKAVLMDITPRQLIDIAGNDLPGSYINRLKKFRYGSGVFKIDYILSEPVPWKDSRTARAGTVHLGGTFEEIAAGEATMDAGNHAENPYVLIAQQSNFDDSRTPDDRQTLWAYCHVPNGSTRDMTEAIERQIERFAPGFKDTIEQRFTMTTNQFHDYNANYIGGDINGGRQDIWQLFTRPLHLINPYATPIDGVYLCSSSTPPGGGVHGMCGYHAATLALKQQFGIKENGLVRSND